MTKEVLEMIKKTIEEIETEKKHIEMEANRIYKEIWKDILLDYKKNDKQKELSFFLTDYIDEQEEKNQKIEELVIEKLNEDGFKLNKIDYYCPAYTITTQKIIDFIKQEEQTEKEEIITKRVITPFAETRRRK